LKGALISFSSPMLIPIPNLIVFQYNPETLSRTLAAYTPPPPADASAKAPDKKLEQPLSQPYDPEETFNLALELDATDALEKPASHPVAVLAGIADRIAALEMLMYPPDDAAGGLLGVSVSVSLGGFSASASLTADTVPNSKVPVVLLFWGPGLVVPVRITSFVVEEQAFSPLLYPLRAKVTLGVKVLDASAFGTDDSAVVKVAKACYTFTRKQRQALALANLANSVESIMGMLPF
jgi:hypothetical protein